MVMPHYLISSVAGDVAGAIAVGGVTIGAAITKVLWGRVQTLEDRAQANVQMLADALHAHAVAAHALAEAVRDLSEERARKAG